MDFDREYDLDIECDGLADGFLDDGEQNLEEEANLMLRSWNRDEFVKEVQEGIEKVKRDEENKKESYYDGETDFDTIAKDMEIVNGNSKVRIKILESNPEGKQIHATDTLLFDRVGYLEYELLPFESSVYDGKPSRISLTEGPIIPGLLQALLSMKEGERANIMIDSSLAYGPIGAVPLIPGYSNLFYNIKIYKVWEESQLNQLIGMENNPIPDLSIEEKLQFVDEHKEIANKLLREDQPREAVIRYKAAIKLLDEVPAGLFKDSDKVSELKITLLQNAAIAFNKLKMHKAATTTAKRALFINPKNVKAFYQLAKARIGLHDYSSAVKWIEKASQLFPETSVFDHLKLELDFQYREETRKKDEILKKMSKAYI